MPTAAKTKQVSIVLAGSGEQRHGIGVLRGVTVRDFLERLNMSGHLTKYGDPAPLGETEEVYSRVEDGDKLVLGPFTSVAQRRAA